VSEETPAPETKPLDLKSVVSLDGDDIPYEPLRVTFRGQEYAFGGSALGVFAALDVDTQGGLGIKDGESPISYARRIFTVVPPMVKLLCPDFPDATTWTPREEVAILRAVMEVLGRVALLRFQKA
jgi:hypothetical protein